MPTSTTKMGTNFLGPVATG